MERLGMCDFLELLLSMRDSLNEYSYKILKSMFTVPHILGILRFLLLLHLVQKAATDIVNCTYADTVDLTNTEQFTNGSYRYGSIVIPPSLVGTYDYKLHYDDRREPVAEHVRGCVCHLRPCVKFCCHPEELKITESLECSREIAADLIYSPYINVTLRNGSRQNVHVLEDFVVQQGIPCDKAYALNPEIDQSYYWELFENGTLLRLNDSVYLSKQQYCFTPDRSRNDDVYVLNPINCSTYSEQPISELLNSIAMLISIPFLVMTVLVYLFIPQLRNLHGKCLICYLCSMAIGYSIIVFISLSSMNFSDNVCSFMGFTAYFFFMAAFFWLSVISFDLWHNFRGTTSSLQRSRHKKRFVIYSAYAWGLPTSLTALTIAGQLSNLNDSLKPGIGKDYCWLTPLDWSAMIYFYGPVLLIIVLNIVLFVMTSRKIYQVKKDLERMMARDERSCRLNNQKDNFWLFLRLFIVMGATWLLEVISYMVGQSNVWSYFFYLPDLCNATQGIIIFTLFVLKRKVVLLIRKRVYSLHNKPTTENERNNISMRSTANDQHCGMNTRLTAYTTTTTIN